MARDSNLGPLQDSPVFYHEAIPVLESQKAVTLPLHLVCTPNYNWRRLRETSTYYQYKLILCHDRNDHANYVLRLQKLHFRAVFEFPVSLPCPGLLSISDITAIPTFLALLGSDAMKPFYT